MHPLPAHAKGGKGACQLFGPHAENQLTCMQVWDLLAWQGAHAQAPVAVVAKPHYFSHLDISETVRRLARSCPGFWASAEFRKCLAGGHILALDPDFFAKVRTTEHGSSMAPPKGQ